MSEWTSFKVFLLTVIDVLALFGNISLFVVLLRKPSLRTQTNVFLLNLATADLLVATVNMPLTIVTLLHGAWMFDEFVCTLSAFLNMLSFVASVMSLAMVSVNRYYFVVKWRTYQTEFSKPRCAVYIMSVWLFSGVLCLPPLFGWAEYRFIAEQYQCFVDWSSSVSYLFSMAVICLFGLVTTMVFSYWKIWTFSSNSVKKLMSTKKSGESSSRNVNSSLASCKASYPYIASDRIIRLQELDIGVAQHQDGSSASREAKAEGFSAAYTKSTDQTSTHGRRRDHGRDEGIMDEENSPPHQHLQSRHQPQQKRREEDIRQRSPAKGRANRRTQPHVDAKRTRTLFIIVATFCLCWSPYAITCILQEALPSSSFPRAVWFGVLWLGCANSACNVVIYVSTSRKIRKEFKEMFKGWFCRS